MDVFLQTIVSGLLIGGIYGLIGIGMTLIMGVMGIINLAHGQLMMVAMYITFVLSAYLHIDPYVSLLVAMPALFLLGAFLQKFLLNPLMKIDSILPENQVLMTVGIGMVLTETARFIFSSDYKTVKTPYSGTALFLGKLSFNLPMCIAFAIAVLVYAVYMKMWKYSVSTMIFVVSSAWCVLLDPGSGDDTIRYSGLMILETVAVLRAGLKAEGDHFIPENKHHVSG